MWLVVGFILLVKCFKKMCKLIQSTLLWLNPIFPHRRSRRLRHRNSYLSAFGSPSGDVTGEIAPVVETSVKINKQKDWLYSGGREAIEQWLARCAAMKDLSSCCQCAAMKEWQLRNQLQDSKSAAIILEM